MAKVEKVVIVDESDPTIQVSANLAEDVPEGFAVATERRVTWPQSPETVLGWLTYGQLLEIAVESEIATPTVFSKTELVEEIMKAKSMILYDGGDALAPTSGEATLDGGAITVETTAVTASSVIVATPIDAPDGYIYVGNISAGVSFTINSTDIGDTARVRWVMIQS